jgi:16S rRNA (guanine966-N2)-methyltransferase
MRISSGTERGRRLRSPRGGRTRPTPAILRQAIFNILGPAIQGARVLDLFAGTGAVGLEALSRGAAGTIFVERDRRALASLQANLAAPGFAGRGRVMEADGLSALAALEAADERFDCIFLDPPYGTDLAWRCIETLASGQVLRENGAVFVQAFHKATLPERAGVLMRDRQRRYGSNSLTVYRKEAPCM